ncbi:MAG: apolipoprotein N-acyltransferase [Corynebacterium sp.]|nr:apolipoprotein N-acyltransferase [Corynebacterium sp.]
MLLLILRLLAAAASGLSIYASYEPLGWSWAAPLGIALLYWALQGRIGWKQGLLVGIVQSLSLYLLLLPWVGEFVGNMPFWTLSGYLAIFSAVFGALSPALLRRRLGWLQWIFVYVAIEWLRSDYPFGGFAWVRLAWGQINSPLVWFAPYGGPALVTFVTLVCGVGLARSIQKAWTSRQLTAIFNKSLVLTLGVVVLAIATQQLTQAQRPADIGTTEVAAVQGNVPRMGLDFNAQRSAVLRNHTQETTAIATDGIHPDFVIWPENSSDINPLTDTAAGVLIDDAANAVDAPILVGTITRDDVGMRNTMLVWDPETGVGDYHYKKYLQPFGEWMPWRDFFRNFSELVDLAGDFQPGTGSGVVHIRTANTGQTIPVGISTCYEVAFDASGRDAVANGAQILTTPTNNATFGFTDMTYQQLAMSRFRAIELDRSVVVAATSGVSAMVDHNGTVLADTRIFTPDYLVADMSLRDTTTFAVRYGTWIEYSFVILGAIGVLGLLWNRIALQRRSK